MPADGARLCPNAARKRAASGDRVGKPDDRPGSAAGRRQLHALPLQHELSAKSYEEKRDKWLGRLNQAVRAANTAGRAVTFVFEGWDAAGKGGAIRRLTGAIDPRLYRMQSVAAPTDEERAHPYLWRFWRDLPRQGHITIYDRSWYGRVLVERIEGFCAPADWQRAYSEINEFEAQLAEFGTIVLKFWLAIGSEEELRRFKDRQITPYKQYKLTEEDWRNRATWDAYETAAADMVERTSTDHAPRILVEANDKNWARIKVIKTVVKALKKALKE